MKIISGSFQTVFIHASHRVSVMYRHDDTGQVSSLVLRCESCNRPLVEFDPWQREDAKPPCIVLEGNPGDGFVARGPYADYDEAIGATEMGSEVCVMILEEP